MELRRTSVGQWISGAGHAGLILWLVFGWGLSNDPLPFEIAQVSVVSGAEYAEIVAASTPQPTVDAPAAPSEPAASEAAPEAPAAEPQPQVTPPQSAPEQPVVETPPPAAPEQPAIVAEVEDTAPVAPTPPSTAPGAVDLPPSDRPKPRPADIVSSQPTPPTPPEAETAPQAAPAIDEQAEVVLDEVVQEETPAAQEQTAPIIVNADDTPAGAEVPSTRPPSRPANLAPPVQAPTVAETPVDSQPAATQTAAEEAPAAPAADQEAADIAAALAAAGAATSAPSSAPAGPPLTGGETGAFLDAVGACWTVDSGGQAAEVVVTLAFSLDRDGKVVGNNVELVGYEGGNETVANTAYQSARRAILRCQSSGYDLPDDKYEQWKDVEITFDPRSMSLR